MEHAFTEVWSFTVGTTSQQTMGLLPSSSNKTYKVAVVDNNGVLTCKGIKNDVPSTTFTSVAGRKGNRLTIVKDRIFFASGHEVRGFSKKGKNFYNIETFMSEEITSMAIFGSELHLAGQHLYSHYVDNKERPYHNSPAQINDILALPLPATLHACADPDAENSILLACADRALRIVQGRDVISELLFSKYCPAVLCEYQPKSRAGYVLYGSDAGVFGLVQFGLETGGSEIWVMDDLAGTAPITSLFSYDLTDNGNHDIVVGRDDGKLQTYAMLDVLDEPELVAETTLPSAITSVAAGRVGNAGRVDVVAATYSGVVAGFSTTASHMVGPEDRQKRLQEQLGALKRELQGLSSEKAGLETKLKTKPGAIRTESLPTFDVNDSLRLNENDGTHTLFIETAVALDMVILRSSGPIGLMPPQDSGRVAFHEQKPGPDGGPTVGTYRCQSDVTRLELKLNTLEGQHSTLEALIIPRTTPMVCLKRKYLMCALSLHQLTSLPLDDQRPINTLKLTGGFSLAEIHAWMAMCFPGVDGTRPSELVVTVTYFSPFVGTQVECFYADGIAEFKSDSLMAISILKDTITQEATKKKVSVKTASTTAEGSIAHSLSFLAPRFEHFHELYEKTALLESVRELMSQESSTDFLSEEQKHVLRTAQEIDSLGKEYPLQFESMCSMVERLYVDSFKFKGIDVRSKVPALRDHLENYQGIEYLLDFFEDSG